MFITYLRNNKWTLLNLYALIIYKLLKKCNMEKTEDYVIHINFSVVNFIITRIYIYLKTLSKYMGRNIYFYRQSVA